MLCDVQVPQDDNVIIGIEGFEDAGVYKITDEIALVQTIDFFTPVVDDPYWFGQDCGRKRVQRHLRDGGNTEDRHEHGLFLAETLRCRHAKRDHQRWDRQDTEAGASLLGGHSVEDEEIKYGLSVTGLVHPDKILRNEGAKVPGDVLILTKTARTGILNTAIKADLVTEETLKKLIEVMACLNDKASSGNACGPNTRGDGCHRVRPGWPSFGNDQRQPGSKAVPWIDFPILTR